MVFQSVRNYLYDRRRGLAKFAGFAGGVYLVGHYALQRLEETREKILQDRTARENIKRRFQQNQEDCVFTTLALVPGLGNQILEELDVEGLTLQLQQHGSTRNQSGTSDLASSSIVLEDGRGQPRASETDAKLDQLATVDPLPQEANTDAPEESTVQDGENDSSSTTVVPLDSSQSWIQEFAATQSQHQSNQESSSSTTSPFVPLSGSVLASEDGDAIRSVISTVDGEEESDQKLGESTFTHLETSEVTESFENSSQSDYFRRSPAPSPSPPPAPPKTKAELWKELKTTTFVRTLTILYSLVLLTLTTHVQLNILASHKYVQSVIEMESEEKEREQWGSVLGMGSSTGGIMGMFLGLGSGSRSNFTFDDDIGDLDENRRRMVLRISDLTSRKYLTMSWWLLNVGWKVILDKVQRAVEDVLDPIPLKAQMTVESLRLYLDAIREKVEHESSNDEATDELTAEEQEQLQGAPAPPTVLSSQRTDFLPSLLPLTRAAEQHVLVQGGIPPEAIFSYDSESQKEEEALRTLLDETKSILSSKDFEIVLNKALEWAMGVLVEGIAREVYGEDEESQQKSLRLASLLPGVTRWSHLAVNALPNEMIDGVANLPEVNALSAIIFASFEDRLRST